MMPVPAEFDRLLRVRVRDHKGKEHEKVLRVPCVKPAAPAAPTAEDLRCLAPLELALSEALTAQRVCWDAEALLAAFAPLSKFVGDSQGIRENSVDLSLKALDNLFGTQGKRLMLFDLPEDLRELKAEMRELMVESVALCEVPEWVGEFVHLEVLQLESNDGENPVLKKLPASFGNLCALKSLTLMNLVALDALPVSMRLTSLETLAIDGCDALIGLPACVEQWTALQSLSLRGLPYFTDLPATIAALTNLHELSVSGCAIEELPATLGDSLKTLTLRDLALDVLPASIGLLTSLETVIIDYCLKLQELPASITALTNLHHLSVSTCFLKELPALGDLRSMKTLTLMNLTAIHALPASIGRLTSLQTLRIERCVTLKELPTSIAALTNLHQLSVCGCAIKGLPASLGNLPLKTLTLRELNALKSLPVSMRLTSLESLRIEDCGVLQALPACVEQWTALQSLSLAFLPNFTELPPTVAALTNLHELVICICAIKELPALIGELTKLTTLRVMDCALIDVPWSIESLTALRDLRLDVITAAHPHCRAFTKLACSLPALRLLESLELHGLDEGDALAIARSLKAWPLPYLVQRNYRMEFNICWQALGLPPAAAGWDDNAVLQYWCVQQHKVVAFASGLHVRLGAASRVSSLNDVALVLIADEVLGGWSLLKMWQRERLVCETKAASSST